MRIVTFATILVVMAVRAFAMDITTRTGTIYRHCEVTRVESDGIVITSVDGVARIPFEDMPDALQAQYHLNAIAVGEYRKRLADSQAAVARKAADELKARMDAAAKVEKEKRPMEKRPRPASERPKANPQPAEMAGEHMGAHSEASAQKALFFCAAILALFALAIWVGRKIHGAWRWQRICAESDAFLHALEQGDEMPVAETHLPLLDNERAHFCAQSSLYETRAVRLYHANHSGFRVTRGVWIGGTRGYSVSRQEWTRIDSGILTVTNRRLVFEGQYETRIFNLRRIMVVNPTRDSVEVSVENRQKCMVFEAKNPLILASILRICCRVLEMAHERVPEPEPAGRRAEYGRTHHSAPPPREEPPPEPETKQRRWRSPEPKVESEEAVHGQVLGLTGKVTFADIRREYRQRMVEYHPDKVAALGPKLRALAEEETKKINAAYAFFANKYAPRGGA